MRRWMVRIIVAPLLVMLAIPSLNGCQRHPGTSGATMSTSASLSTGGLDRSYQLHVPATLPAGEAVPLVVALHGGMGNGHQFEQATGLDALADEYGFVIAYPDGTPVAGRADQLVWNAGGCCGPAADGRDAVDDVAFIASLIDDIGQDHAIDPRRVYAIGHSNGGMLAYRLACQLPDTFAAVGIQSGTLVSEPCTPRSGVSLVHIHGTADTKVPIDGGQGSSSLTRVPYPSPRGSVARFAAADGCSDDPGTTENPANGTTSTTWGGCRDAGTVEFLAVAGAAHAWMDGGGALDTSRTIVDFFADHGGLER